MDIPSIATSSQRLRSSSRGGGVFFPTTRNQDSPALATAESKTQGKRWAVSRADRITWTTDGRRIMLAEAIRVVRESQEQSRQRWCRGTSSRPDPLSHLQILSLHGEVADSEAEASGTCKKPLEGRPEQFIRNFHLIPNPWVYTQ